MALEAQGCQPVFGQRILCFRGVSENLPVATTDVPDSPTTVSSPLPDISNHLSPLSDAPQVPGNQWADMATIVGPGPTQLAMINSLTPKGSSLVQLACLK
jgi:hypothetical protein